MQWARPRPRNAAAAERTPDRPYEFSFNKLGNPISSALLLLIAVVLALSPLFLPDPLTPRLVVAAVRHLGAFRLNDPLHEGLFTASDRSGDVQPSTSATATAVAALSLAAPELRPPLAAPLKDLAHKLLNEPKLNIRDFYEAAVISRNVGALDSSEARALVAAIHQLRETDSGYRADLDHSATLSSTALALEALDALKGGEISEKVAGFSQVVPFVRSLKHSSGGFRDALHAPPSLSATFDAWSVLKHLPREQLIEALGNDTEAFVFSCQAEDGGFREFPRPPLPQNGSVPEVNADESSVVTTAKAVYLLQAFEELSLPSSTNGSSSLFAMARSTQHATNYLRACLSLSHGVKQSYSSQRRSLEGTLLFLRLVNDFRGLKLGVPPSLPNVLLVLAGFAATAALLLLYAPQLVGPMFNALVQRTLVVFVLLSASVALLGYAPLASLFGFIPLGFYLALRFYEASEQDTQDGLSLLCATINGLVVGGSVYAFNRWAPLLWLQLRAYTTLALVFASSSYVTTLCVCYFSNIRRMQISLNGGIMSWLIAESVLYGWVFGRSDALSMLAYRALGAHGYFPVVFWGLPLISWCSSLAAAALATFTVAFFMGRVKHA